MKIPVIITLLASAAFAQDPVQIPLFQVGLDDAVHAHPFGQSSIYRMPGYTQNSRPFGYTFIKAGVFDNPSSTSIFGLLYFASPAHIPNKVPNRVIYSIQCHTFGPISHNGVKELERCQFRVESQRVVPRVPLCFRIPTSFEHGYPTLMRPRPILPMRGIRPGYSPAATRSRSPRSETHPENIFYSATITVAYPRGSRFTIENSIIPPSNDEELSVFVSREIY